MVRKKSVKNVVKLDVGEFVRVKGKVLPLVVQETSKDGRRVKKKVHEFQAPEIQLTPVFNPVPVFESVQDDVFPNADESEADIVSFTLFSNVASYS